MSRNLLTEVAELDPHLAGEARLDPHLAGEALGGPRLLRRGNRETDASPPGDNGMTPQ
ncbi:hypothetical protein ABZZ79_36525 [Streptomyces sp. NPDC006458]|uniref:hypothetical protein n=1 Tax=Streptomyces sp. NPDC006458 TaxID=3154302 RepID=UPI0033B3A370